jgi:hypothetical protein
MPRPRSPIPTSLEVARRLGRGQVLDSGPKQAWGVAFFAVLWNLVAFPPG